MVTTTTAAGAFALGLAAVHVLAGRLGRLDPASRRATVSFAGGVSVAYVFALLLPEVNRAVLEAVESGSTVGSFFRRDVHVYLVVLLGFVVFYGVHALVATSNRDAEASDAATPVFVAHVVAFTGYNALVGYLLFHQEGPGLLELSFYAVALGMHFLVVDASFRRHHGTAYDRLGRWILAGAVLAGAAVGAVTPIDEATLSVLFAFLAGSVVFNSIREELPEPGRIRYLAFLVGTGVYSAVLLFA
ncbi:hypothetical protein [Halomarina ordinaria]|uniref:Uncharacterized protein n=1 Tax=Halomarina ordinaria TaxID=3033939 RepID=A0ABD5U705_9EURY|nr:hypothetical protein [Halomarina sp. PSRA2]